MSKALDIANNLSEFDGLSPAIDLSDVTATNVNPTNLNIASTNHTFTVKGIDAAITDSQSGSSPDVSDANSGQMAIYNGATKLWGINEDGWVQQPNNVSWSYAAFTFSATGIGSNGTILLNNSNSFSSSSGAFTAPINGVYITHISVLMESASNRMEIIFRKNNSSSINGISYAAANDYSPSAGYTNCINTYIFEMSAGDYLDAYISIGTPYSGHASRYDTIFWGYLIG